MLQSAMLGATLHAPSRENRIKLDIRARGIEIEICFFSSLFLQKKKKSAGKRALALEASTEPRVPILLRESEPFLCPLEGQRRKSKVQV